MASSGPSRHSSSRHHSHSVSLGAFNPDHRITRRKSVNTNTINNSNAIRAAINGLDESTAKPAHRRSLTSKGANRHTEMGPDASVGGQKGLEARGIDESAVTDDVDSTPQMGDASKARARRASEGSQLTGKRGSGELRCEKCGKGYKHSSCLTKHLLVLHLPRHLFHLISLALMGHKLWQGAIYRPELCKGLRRTTY